MTVTATVDTAGRVPRVTVTVTAAGTVTGISVTRTAQGATVPLRRQPTAGPSPRIVDDYEAPWGTPVVFTATVTTGSGTVVESSSTVTIDGAWPCVIHPTSPALSFRLDQATPTLAGVRTLGPVSRLATDTAHQVLGSPRAVYTRTGPRGASRIVLTLTTTTLLELGAVIAAVTDQTPLLIRAPAGWGWGWEDGYYRVGDVEETRRTGYGPDSTRTLTLPLERVDEPAGSQQPERTYATVLNDFAGYPNVRAAYGTYTALLTDVRT